VRRVVAFRMDAIGWGFILHLAINRIKILDRISVTSALAAILALGSAALGTTIALSYAQTTALETAFPFYASAFGASAIVLALKLPARGHIAAIGLFLGRMSYSVYLFHLLVMLPLSRISAPWPILLVVYLIITTLIAWLVYTAIEAPILAARPKFSRRITRTEIAVAN
jgi:peptidoglycan/LPS O-acetylase OafA/YrhL